MKFLTDENGALYAYDEQSGLTLQFIGGKWDLAPVTYIVLAHDDKFFALSDEEAIFKASGISPHGFLKNYVKYLNS